MQIYISITNVLLTIFIILFGALQWRAIKEQNNLNLLKLRVEHYKNAKKQIHDIWSAIELLMGNSKKDLTELQKVHTSLKNFAENIDESLFLFGEIVYKFESHFMKTTRRYLNIIEKRPNKKLNTRYFKDFVNEYTTLCIDIIKIKK
jgi:hypothetical protein